MVFMFFEARAIYICINALVVLLSEKQERKKSFVSKEKPKILFHVNGKCKCVGSHATFVAENRNSRYVWIKNIARTSAKIGLFLAHELYTSHYLCTLQYIVS